MPRSRFGLPFLREQREARRMVLRVLEQTIPVPIGQADRGEQLFRGSRIVRGLGQPRPVPDLVGRRLGSVDRHPGAKENGIGEERAIHRHRDRAAELVALQPGRAAVLSERPGFQVEPQAVRVARHAEVEQLDASLVGGALQRGVGLGRNLAGHHVELSRLEPQQLGALVRDDLDDQTVEVWQRRAVRRLAEIARVAREDDALPGQVLAQDERAEADHLGRRRVEAPGFDERAGLQRRLELVARENRQAVEQADARREGHRKGDDDGVRIGGRDLELLAAGLHRVGEHAAVLLVVHRLERKQHIVGGEGVAVGEDDVALER